MKNVLKIISCVSTLTLALTILPTNITFAKSENTPQNKLSQFLSAVQSKNIDEAVSIYIDNRLGGNQQAEKNFLSVLTTDPNEEIQSFKILDKHFDLTDSKIILANVTYKNKREAQTPFKLQLVNNKWFVIADENMVMASEYKVLNQPVDKVEPLVTTASNKSVESIITPNSATLGNWGTYLSCVEPYSPDRAYSNSFDVNNPAGLVTINFQQYRINENYQASIEYAVVTRSLTSDTVYGSIIVTGEYSTGIKRTISLSKYSISTAYIRMKNQNVSQTLWAYGQVYNGY